MKILIIHNHYKHPGGEDKVVEAEKRMLEKFGHKVILYEQSNFQFDDLKLLSQIAFTLKGVFWSKHSYQAIRQLIKDERPDIAHFHNAFFFVSSSAYEACYEARIPMVQTLHNYRFLCPIGTFYRKRQVCENCLQSGKISAVVHKCWKNSFFYSLLLVMVLRDLKKEKFSLKKLITLLP